jgi:hypothetical protein
VIVDHNEGRWLSLFREADNWRFPCAEPRRQTAQAFTFVLFLRRCSTAGFKRRLTCAFAFNPARPSDGVAGNISVKSHGPSDHEHTKMLSADVHAVNNAAALADLAAKRLYDLVARHRSRLASLTRAWIVLS